MASRFWVGGTGTWDASDTTHWSATSGGATGASVPTTTDTVTFNGSSGGGTVTVNTTVDVTSLTMGAFTGTLTFATNNNNVTLQSFSGTGTGTRTLSMGNGTWTITAAGAAWDITTATNMTLNANSSNLKFTNTTNSEQFFELNSTLTYATVTLGPNSNKGDYAFDGSATIGTLAVVAPAYIGCVSGNTITVTNALAWTGSSSNQIYWAAPKIGTFNLSCANNSTFTWTALYGIACAGGGTFTATNSFDLKGNTGVTITAPSTSGGSGGGRVIGG
jgi:hypothetical protein